MSQTCSGAQASDRFGIVLDFVTKLGNGSITEQEAKLFLRRQNPFPEKEEIMPEETTLSFSILATTNLIAVEGKKTSKCFTDKKRYYHRDADFDKWLPANQPDAPTSVISTLAFSQDWTFVEAAAKILGLDADTSIVALGKLLIENGHTMTLAQAEEMVEATERKEPTEMRTDGYANFFFVATGNEANPVSVGDVHRVDRGWFAFVFRLDRGNRWDADIRFLLRNLDTSKLGL